MTVQLAWTVIRKALAIQTTNKRSCLQPVNTHASSGVSLTVHTYWDRTLYHPDDLPYHAYGGGTSRAVRRRGGAGGDAWPGGRCARCGERLPEAWPRYNLSLLLPARCQVKVKRWHPPPPPRPSTPTRTASAASRPS